MMGSEYQAGQTKHERSVSIDWMNASAPRESLVALTRAVAEYLGDPVDGGSGGVLGPASYIWMEGAARLYFDPDPEAQPHVVLMIRGEACKHLGEHALEDIGETVKHLDGRITRFDVAVDLYHNTAEGLIETMYEACEESLLCRAKRYQLVIGKSAGESTGVTLYLGARGSNGSGRYVRVYDKGLESDTMPKGMWIRFETEFSKEAAETAFSRYFRGDFGDRQRLAFDAVEFRDRPELSRTDERPYCSWWVKLRNTDARAQIITVPKLASTVHSMVKWYCNAVLPGLSRVATALGQDFDQALFTITSETAQEGSERYNANPRVEALVRFMKAQQTVGTVEIDPDVVPRTGSDFGAWTAADVQAYTGGFVPAEAG